MEAYETIAIVEKTGQVRVVGVPFAPGTEVEVIVNPKRQSTEEFAAQWNRVCEQMRIRSGEISDEEIQKEINAHRART
jgi:hypothetical protein